MEVIDDLSSNSRRSPWWRMLADFLSALADETADALLPVDGAIDALYGYIAEQRRKKSLGSGVFLGTIHSTKGSEFGHVVILDRDWVMSDNSKRNEEERRTLYVGMTRAKETLALMRAANNPNPFLRELTGEAFLSRKAGAPIGLSGLDTAKQYEMLELSDVYLDYAGGLPQGHAINAHLANLQAGATVFLAAGRAAIEIRDFDGFCVGRLSNNATEIWRDKSDRIFEARVVALVQRGRMDPQKDFRDRIKAEKWEVPLIEVVLK
jgi:ATP-dependent DNA helicase RecQ